MTRLSASEMALVREGIAEARDDFGGYVTQPDLSRALIAQCNLIERLLDEDDHERVTGALMGLMAALNAAGPQSFRCGVEVEEE